MDNFRRIITKSELEEIATPFTNSSEILGKNITKIYIPYLWFGVKDTAESSKRIYNTTFLSSGLFNEAYYMTSTGRISKLYFSNNWSFGYSGFSYVLSSDTAGGTGSRSDFGVSFINDPTSWRLLIACIRGGSSSSYGIHIACPFYSICGPSRSSNYRTAYYKMDVASIIDTYGEMVYYCLDFTKINSGGMYCAYVTSTATTGKEIYDTTNSLYSSAVEECPWYYEEYEE